MKNRGVASEEESKDGEREEDMKGGRKGRNDLKKEAATRMSGSTQESMHR